MPEFRERVRWMDVGPYRFVPTGPLRTVHLGETLLAADAPRPGRFVARPRDWVVVVFGLADKEGKGFDQGLFEQRFASLRTAQIERPASATFRYQVGLYGGRRELSVSVEVWPEKGETIDELGERMIGLFGTLLTETDQERAVMQIWVAGALESLGDILP